MTLQMSKWDAKCHFSLSSGSSPNLKEAISYLALGERENRPSPLNDILTPFL